MANYDELQSIMNDPQLTDKVEVACIIAAQGIIGGTETNQAAREKWAALVFSNPRNMAKRMLPVVVAANAGQTIATITGASDVAIQNNVDQAVDLFANTLP